MEYTLEQLIVEWEAQIASMKYYNYNTILYNDYIIKL